jgi:hypothetical protein
MTTLNVASAGPNATGIIRDFKARLATLRSIRAWAGVDPVRLRDADYLARHAQEDLDRQLDEISVKLEPPRANPDLGGAALGQFAATLAAAAAETAQSRSRERRRRWPHVTRRLMGEVIACLVLALLVLGLAVTFVPAILYPNHAARLTDLLRLKDALKHYRADHGHFPVTHNPDGHDWVGIGWGDAGDNWIPELVPDYLPSVPRDPRNSNVKFAQYLYRSDGQDFKVISLSPEDCQLTILLNPWLRDETRASPSCGAYGVWTKGAKLW